MTTSDRKKIADMKRQGMALLRANRLPQAGDLYRQVIVMSPDDADAWYRMSPGGGFDHAGPAMNGKSCTNCHDGTLAGAAGKSANHVVTSAYCGACHAVVTFADASMDHAVVTFEGSQICHDGKHDGANSMHISTAQPSGHIVSKPEGVKGPRCGNAGLSASQGSAMPKTRPLRLPRR